MILTSRPYIGSAICVLTFKERIAQVRFEQGLAEASFGGFVNGQSQQTNLPDSADPTQPRIFFHSEKKSISISQLACQLQMSFKGSELPFFSQLLIVKKNINEFYERALKFRNKDIYSVSGVVLDINFPSNDPITDLHQYLHNQYIKTKPLGEIAAVQATFGYKINEYFLNFSASVYESRRFEINMVVAPPTAVPNDTSSVVETGLAIRLDVNDQPKGKVGTQSAISPSALMSAVDDFFANNFREISGLSLEQEQSNA